MATPNETIRYFLFRYPTLYKNPIDVLISVFLGTSAHQWKNGEIDKGDWDRTNMEEMYYDSQFIHKNDSAGDTLSDLYTGYTLQEEAELARMQFVDENIVKILKAPHTNTYFGSEPFGMRIVQDMWHVNYKEGQNLKLPKNLNKEWAIELCEFIQYIQVRLNCAYQVGDGKTEAQWTAHWPIEAKRARDVLNRANEQYYPIAYGKSKKQADKEMDDFMSNILKDID